MGKPWSTNGAGLAGAAVNVPEFSFTQWLYWTVHFEEELRIIFGSLWLLNTWRSPSSQALDPPAHRDLERALERKVWYLTFEAPENSL